MLGGLQGTGQGLGVVGAGRCGWFYSSKDSGCSEWQGRSNRGEVTLQGSGLSTAGGVQRKVSMFWLREPQSAQENFRLHSIEISISFLFWDWRGTKEIIPCSLIGPLGREHARTWFNKLWDLKNNYVELHWQPSPVPSPIDHLWWQPFLLNVKQVALRDRECNVMKAFMSEIKTRCFGACLCYLQQRVS